MGEPVLSLKTAVEPTRPTVEIDGGAYRLAIPADFGLRESAKFQANARELDRLQSKEQITEKDIDRLVDLVDSLVKKVVPDLPSDVFAKLSDDNKLALIGAFTAEAEKRRAALQVKPEKPEPKEKP